MEKINLNGILHDSVVDGPGLRTVIFTQGCKHKCRGCHNVDSWSLKENQIYFVDDLIKKIITDTPTKKVTLSGGEPFLQQHQILKIAKSLKEKNFHICIYSGYTYEQLIKEDINKLILSYCDILVDGKYVEEKKDISLSMKGSTNQKIINLKNGEVS